MTLERLQRPTWFITVLPNLRPDRNHIRSQAKETTHGGQALSVLLAARRSAVDAATIAQRQLFSLVIAAPEPRRARFRGRQLPAMIQTAAGLRINRAWDTETTIVGDG